MPLDEQKLNRKLAKWAGFYDTKHPVIDNWRTPDRKKSISVHDLPSFVESLDDCFEHLVPKLEPLGYDLEICNDLELMGWSVCLHNTTSECSIASPIEHCQLEEIALALCLAIEKLINNESEESANALR